MSFRTEEENKKLGLWLFILLASFASAGVEMLLWDWHVVGAAGALFNYTVAEITYWQACAISLPVSAFRYRGNSDPDPDSSGLARALSRFLNAYLFMLFLGWMLSGVWV